MSPINTCVLHICHDLWNNCCLRTSQVAEPPGTFHFPFDPIHRRGIMGITMMVCTPGVPTLLPHQLLTVTWLMRHPCNRISASQEATLDATVLAWVSRQNKGLKWELNINNLLGSMTLGVWPRNYKRGVGQRRCKTSEQSWNSAPQCLPEGKKWTTHKTK